jgi:hypothetical protein
MKRTWITFFSLTILILSLCSCESTDDVTSLVVPDRDKEGLTGPGVRLADSGHIGTNQVERLSSAQYAPTEYLRRQQNQPVDGVDFFQYKSKF